MYISKQNLSTSLPISVTGSDPHPNKRNQSVAKMEYYTYKGASSIANSKFASLINTHVSREQIVNTICFANEKLLKNRSKKTSPAPNTKLLQFQEMQTCRYII